MIGFVIACAVLVAVMLVAAAREAKHLVWVAKPLASACFVAAAVTRGALDHRAGQAIVVGLALAWIGDGLLLGRGRAALLAGLVAFLAGHVAYVVGFVVTGLDRVPTTAAAVAVSLIGLRVGRYLYPHVERAMWLPVIGYLIVITGMLATAAGAAVSTLDGWPVLGALAFYVSDLAVARERFVAQSWWNKLWGWPLYYGGQLMLAYWAGN